MKIENFSAVTMHYTLKDTKGNTIESSFGDEPLTYIHGTKTVIPGLEKALLGKKAGEKLSITVEPEEGYGEYDPELVQTADISDFQDQNSVVVGGEFEVFTEDDRIYLATITKIEGDEITFDMNHDLAGKTLSFDIEVLDVREATAEEIEHGHVHGDEECNHDH